MPVIVVSEQALAPIMSELHGLGNEQAISVLHQVRKMGGLLVLSTNFQESRRIENQLKGRAGRQVWLKTLSLWSTERPCRPLRLGVIIERCVLRGHPRRSAGHVSMRRKPHFRLTCAITHDCACREILERQWSCWIMTTGSSRRWVLDP